MLQNVFWVRLSSRCSAVPLQGVKSKLLSAGDVLNPNSAWGQKCCSGAAQQCTYLFHYIMPSTTSPARGEGFLSDLRLRKKLPPGQQSTLKTIPSGISMRRAGPACSCSSIARARRKEASCLTFSSRPLQAPLALALPLWSGP